MYAVRVVFRLNDMTVFGQKANMFVVPQQYISRYWCTIQVYRGSHAGCVDTILMYRIAPVGPRRHRKNTVDETYTVVMLDTAAILTPHNTAIIGNILTLH